MAAPDDVRTALARLGGVATSRELSGLVSRHQVRSAVTAGVITRVRRDRYVIAEAVDGARLLALQLGGSVSHLSAAQLHGWALKVPPDRPWVTVPRGRPRTLARAHIRVADLPPEDLGMTGALRTVVDCARILPFDEALCVADSALRRGDVTPGELAAAAALVQGPGARAVRRVLGAADGRAQNPFESVLRALTLEFPGLGFEPQGEIEVDGLVIHPDLVEFDRRMVLEADSFEFHTGREAHLRDCSRYNALMLAGWLVLRFGWEHVMLRPDYVRSQLARIESALHPPQRPVMGC